MGEMIAGAVKAIVELVTAIFKRKNDKDILDNAKAKEEQKADDKVDDALKTNNEDEIRHSAG